MSYAMLRLSLALFRVVHVLLGVSTGSGLAGISVTGSSFSSSGGIPGSSFPSGSGTTGSSFLSGGDITNGGFLSSCLGSSIRGVRPHEVAEMGFDLLTLLPLVVRDVHRGRACGRGAVASLDLLVEGPALGSLVASCRHKETIGGAEKWGVNAHVF